MPLYRLTTERGETVASTSADDDRAAVAWRSAHPFTAPTPDTEGRHLRLERETDTGWIELRAGGTTEAS